MQTSVGGYWDNAPVGIVFDEIGTMYEWDRDGRVWIFENDERLAEPLIDLRQEVGNWSDHGMLGFALDPDFRQNGYIYLMYVVDYHHLAHYGSTQYDPAANEYYRATIGRITRYTANASDNFRSVDAASRKVLVGETADTGFPILSDQHGVGTLLFGSDGTLMASCGDTTLPGDYGDHPDTYYAQALSEGIIQPKENIGMFRAQLPDSLNGKVLRIDASTGNGIPSNPFYDPVHPRAARSRVWALGLRNPFRMTLRPGTGGHSPLDGNPGVLCIGDVGFDTWEELDVATSPGLNFGWPIFEGFSLGFDDGNPLNQDAPNPFYGTNGCMQQYFTFRDLLTEATLDMPSWPNPCDPDQQIPGSIRRFVHSRPSLDWMHGSGPSRTGIFTGTTAAVVNIGETGSPVVGPQFGGNCSVGGTWYQGNDFPAQYNNTYFHADFAGSWIRSITFNSDNQPVSVTDFATGVDSVALATDPIRGALYYVSIYEGIYKISYGGNAPPKAAASADVAYGAGPLTVHFTGSGSTDPEARPLSYLWNFGDGSPLSTSANPVHVFGAPAGTPTGYKVTLTVTDSASATNVATLIISLNNTPPAVTITSPVNGTLYPVAGNTVFNLIATVSDAEHAADQLSYRWETVLHHNNHEHRHPIDTNHVTTTVTSPVGCDGNTYYYQIILNVTDPAGLVARSEIALYPDCATNHPPTISAVLDQSISRNTVAGPLSFMIGDMETAASNLGVRGISSNTNLVLDGNIVFWGDSSNRYVAVTPTANQSGSTTITISVSDGSLTNSNSFILTVGQVNVPPVAGPDTLQRFAGYGVKVHVSSLLANDSDPDGDPVVFQSVTNPSTGGGTILLQGGWIHYAPPAGPSGADTFAYLVQDPRGGTNTGIITVQIKTDDAPTQNVAAQNLGNGGFRVRADGIPGLNYLLQYSPSLVIPDWQPLTTNLSGPFGSFQFVDTPNPVPSTRFYRSVLLPP